MSMNGNKSEAEEKANEGEAWQTKLLTGDEKKFRKNQRQSF